MSAAASIRIDKATSRIVDTAAIAGEEASASFSRVIDNTTEIVVKVTVL